MIGFQCSAAGLQPCIRRPTSTLFTTSNGQQVPTSTLSPPPGPGGDHRLVNGGGPGPGNGGHSPSGPPSAASLFGHRPAITPPNLLDYFPGLNNDGLRVTWFHAANTRAKLHAALQGNEIMIEADVSLAESSRYPVPIMAHPPTSCLSDITLEDWLLEVIRSETQKGIKLDFKSTRVVEPAFRVLARYSDSIRGPLVLNADILAGPNKPMLPPVDAWTFLMLCRTRFPNAIISIGWTTDHETLCHKAGYNRDMVDHMASVVKEYSLLQPLTFPVNGALLKYSICEMQRLLFQTPNSTLTVWSHQEDPITVDDLLIIRKAFGTHQLFYDMPDSILIPFKNEVYGR